MKLKENEKEDLRKAINHPDSDRQKREFMDAEQREKFDQNSSGKKGRIDSEDELESREDQRDKKGKKE